MNTYEIMMHLCTQGNVACMFFSIGVLIEDADLGTKQL
jgi:hypothetical protein